MWDSRECLQFRKAPACCGDWGFRLWAVELYGFWLQGFRLNGLGVSGLRVFVSVVAHVFLQKYY